MPKICIVCLVTPSFDTAIIFEQAFAGLNVEVEIIRIPNFFLYDLSLKRLRDIRTLIRDKSRNNFVIFFPNTTELFLEEADLMVAFSGYRTWFRPERMRTIPHLWTPIDLPKDVDDLTWTGKPPLRIGFMGRSHATSRLANAVLNLPVWIKERLLRGSYLQHPTLIALLGEFGISIQNINAFPRIEAIRILRAKKANYAAADLELVERGSFGGTAQEKVDYKNHLRKNTYIICTRGTENYSFRLYETLNFGRIPVIVDTNMVLPKEIDWERLSIIVPYKKLETTYDAIFRDYKSRSSDEFLARQQEAFSVMADLRTMHWAKDFANEVASVAFDKRR